MIRYTHIPYSIRTARGMCKRTISGLITRCQHFNLLSPFTMGTLTILSLLWSLVANPFIAAQAGSVTPTPDPTVSTSAGASTKPSAGPRALADPPDVLLRVPELHVGKIELDVDDLQAEINLAAEVAGLVEINAGVQVGVRKVNITIADVDAGLELDVRLGNLVNIVSRALKSLDLNPLLANVLDTTANVVGDTVDGLLGTIAKGGSAVNVVIDSLGNIVEVEGGSHTVVGNYEQNMTYTGTQTFLDGGLAQKTYSYPPLKALVNVVTDADGKVIQAVVVGEGEKGGGA